MPQNILLTGGAGYIGSVLAPKLLDAGKRLTILDACFFGKKPLASLLDHPHCALVECDIRDSEKVNKVLEEGGFDAVIHLAAISNDPSSDLDPRLTRQVNLEALEQIMKAAKEHKVRRFLYASSASVYGIKSENDVVETLPLEPITLYAQYKAEGEAILNALIDEQFVGVSVRAATVCGYSPRLRLDLTINILTEHALRRGAIRVFGGAQMRPNIHVQDLTDFYLLLLEAPEEKIQGQAFNVSRSNATVLELAHMIQAEIDPGIEIEIVPTNDNRSYHLSAEKVHKTLGFQAKFPLALACQELSKAFQDGRIPDPDSSWYRNVEWMKSHPISRGLDS